ncbi:hypothetical protein BDQ12DRAFT_681556 [Crucibulum laeve]|uniref:Uncharacterized protein n=1 Tax=Crucibulum laeve TaxID=68775 RepID=A0A5C3M5P7_9AGAR|nr:hypothetical protein BDQ12DRAFT_681556 [Crucibulum laeve]
MSAFRIATTLSTCLSITFLRRFARMNYFGLELCLVYLKNLFSACVFMSLDI